MSTNPAIKEGFILSDSKFQTLKLVPEPHCPRCFKILPGEKSTHVLQKMKEKGIVFPIILKPDIGFRGLLVHKVNDKKGLSSLLTTLNVAYLLQEYIAYPLEIGIFYYRFPNEKTGHIPSITIKEFLKVRGDGQATLEELVSRNPRAILQRVRLRRIFKESWECIVPKEEELILEPIGNHNRGTKFVNGEQEYDENLQKVFDTLSHQMKGFYFGRFDIRAASVEALKKGKEFYILEVNGVGAEPTHIYDPEYKLFNAWKELLLLWRIVWRIASINRREGVTFPSFSEGKHRWDTFKRYKQALR
ncbi:D-alanine--D-alanine ligase [Ascidiimonas aurantiaca]|uniref:D-alanine--D-alanine ligase n=1 Tax=Ascidiimonas aurantiaca TaxID=1685432 RepID=UPI0030EFA28E